MFITVISSEANEIAEKEAKKTIAAEHVVKALTDLGFEEYIEQIQEFAQEHKSIRKSFHPFRCFISPPSPPLRHRNWADTSSQSREKKQTKQSGLTEEGLLRHQEELFGRARDKYNQTAQG